MDDCLVHVLHEVCRNPEGCPVHTPRDQASERDMAFFIAGAEAALEVFKNAENSTLGLKKDANSPTRRLQAVVAKLRGQMEEIALDTWPRRFTTGRPTRPRFTWSGWSDGEDVDPPEQGKEWLTVEEAGEELAIIVLRSGAEIFEGAPKLLRAARGQKQRDAQRIVDALNRMEEATSPNV